MEVSAKQDVIRKGSEIVAVFMEYNGDAHRCAKCVFQSSDKKCASAPCLPKERKDRRKGFWRAANAHSGEYRINEAFKGRL